MKKATASRLTREQVVRAALDLVDRDGASALTMRALGRELGVEAMSLYHHVRGREDLLDGMVELLVGELPVASPDTPWSEALRDFTHAIHRTGQRHPQAFALVGLRPLRGAPAHTSVVALLANLADSGLSAEAAVATWRLAVNFARGYALAQASELTLGSAEAAAEVPLPPMVSELVPVLVGDSDATFSLGVEILICGVRAQLS